MCAMCSPACQPEAIGVAYAAAALLEAWRELNTDGRLIIFLTIHIMHLPGRLLNIGFLSDVVNRNKGNKP